MAGEVLVNGQKAEKAGFQVKKEDIITLAVPACPYVSRAGIKLKGALDAFGISPKGRICLDVGVATGGFTDCFLQEGAEKVYAVDVGEGQLHEKLKKDPRVLFRPQTNARYLRPEDFPEKPVLCAIDVSFISLKLILPPVFSVTAGKAEIIALIKPQFELQARDLRKGIVKDEKTRAAAADELRLFVRNNYPGIEDRSLKDSPLRGTHGNLEFLWYLKKLQ